MKSSPTTMNTRKIRRHLHKLDRFLAQPRIPKSPTEQSTVKISDFTCPANSSFTSSRCRRPTSSTSQNPPCWISHPAEEKTYRKLFLSIPYPKTSTMTSLLVDRRHGSPMLSPHTASAVLTRLPSCGVVTTVVLAEVSSVVGVPRTRCRFHKSVFLIRFEFAIGVTS